MIATSVVVPSLSVSAATSAPSVSQSASESIGSPIVAFKKSMTFKGGQTASFGQHLYFNANTNAYFAESDFGPLYIHGPIVRNYQSTNDKDFVRYTLKKVTKTKASPYTTYSVNRQDGVIKTVDIYGKVAGGTDEYTLTYKAKSGATLEMIYSCKVVAEKTETRTFTHTDTVKLGDIKSFKANPSEYDLVNGNLEQYQWFNVTNQTYAFSSTETQMQNIGISENSGYSTGVTQGQNSGQEQYDGVSTGYVLSSQRPYVLKSVSKIKDDVKNTTYWTKAADQQINFSLKGLKTGTDTYKLTYVNQSNPKDKVIVNYKVTTKANVYTLTNNVKSKYMDIYKGDLVKIKAKGTTITSIKSSNPKAITYTKIADGVYKLVVKQVDEECKITVKYKNGVTRSYRITAYNP